MQTAAGVEGSMRLGLVRDVNLGAVGALPPVFGGEKYPAHQTSPEPSAVPALAERRRFSPSGATAFSVLSSTTGSPMPEAHMSAPMWSSTSNTSPTSGQSRPFSNPVGRLTIRTFMSAPDSDGGRELGC